MSTSPLPRTEETLQGIVLRETPLKEHDKLLTILSEECGKVTVYAHGARSLRSRHLVATELLCYSEFLVDKKGERRTLRESALIENFYGLRAHLDAFAFAQYAAQVCADTSPEEEPDPGLLSLLLNSLYLAAKGEKIDKIKAAFELRFCCNHGWMPDLGCCSVCGKEDVPFYLDTLGGDLICENCAEQRMTALAATGAPKGYPPTLQKLTVPTLAALRYVCSAPAKRIFSFQLAASEQQRMGEVCERYLLDQIGHGYDSLTFYHTLQRAGD